MNEKMQQYPAAKLLLVDDDVDTIQMLSHLLHRAGYEIQIAYSGQEALRRAFSFQPDLIILDVVMPEMNGWETLQRIREFSDVPVIMLTGMEKEVDKVRGLDLGADDYLTKPCGVEELKARIRATLRRTRDVAKQQVLAFADGQLVINPANRQVVVRGQEVALSPTEYKILLFLARNAGQILSPRQILRHIWGGDYDDSVKNVKVYIWSLRRKIEENPKEPRYILTRRGAGYYMPRP